MSETVTIADLDSIQGQLGSAVLDLDGKVLRMGGQMTEHNASALYEMLVEVGMLGEEGFERLTVVFSKCNYSVALDTSLIYVVQTSDRGHYALQDQSG
jgi:hypothetical protein